MTNEENNELIYLVKWYVSTMGRYTFIKWVLELKMEL